ncbi:MAG TPA: copper chaperone PCu(A)C [Micropepsaceae bacterium]|nr:copper chaperone PCu(A)C [Micropepsaceae bacterium]
MPNMKFRRETAHNRLPVWAAASCIFVLCGSLAAFAQGTPPAAAPGNPPPAAAPAAPGAPGAPAAPAGDNAARARAAALAAKANIDITEAWTRASGNATTAPIYLHIVSAKDPDKLMGADVAVAGKIEIRDEKGQATPVGAVDVPPGGTVNFGPGGRYLNLVGLKAPLKEGDSFLLTLKFDKAGTSSTAVKVLGSNATGPGAAANARKGDTTSGVTQR